MKDYWIDKGLIRSKNGIPQAPRWFADGRLAFSYDETGINWVEYFARKDCGGNNLVFVKGLFDTFRCFLMKEKLQYAPEYENVELWPFGMTAEWKAGEDSFRLGVMNLEESVVFMLHTPESLSEGYRFKMHFYQSTQLIPAFTGDYRYDPLGMKRVWRDWKYEESQGLLSGGFTETEEDHADSSWQLHIGIGSNQPFEVISKPIQERIDCISEELKENSVYLFYIALDSSEDLLNEKVKMLSNDYERLLKKQYKRYEEVIERAPKLSCQNKDLEDFFALAPMYHESLKLKERPGSIRAQTSRYWNWGWDSMIANMSSAYWGDEKLVEGMLDFFEETSDPLHGIAHAYTLSNRPASYMVAVTQGLYLCLLEGYYAMTGNCEAVLRHYEFAYSIYQRMLGSWKEEAGLFEGMSLFPDFPSMMKETGRDLSLFNNTTAYCSLRSMQLLAELKGDKKTAEEAYGYCTAMEQNFDKILYARDRGFYVNSADSETLQQRDSYNVCGIFWENEYCEDLTYRTMAECMGFMRENAVSEAGIRAIPLWDESYDMDANQLHCTWPAVEGYFVQTANRMKQGDLLCHWGEHVGYWTRNLLCPEGISYMIETKYPEKDRWNTNSGIWQAYSMRSWYQNILHGYLGVLCDNGGFTFSPGGTGDYKIGNMHYMGKTWTIEGIGTGCYIDAVKIGDYSIKESWKLPLDVLEMADSTTIRVFTTGEERGLYLRKCMGAALRNFAGGEKELRFTVSGLGECKIYYHSKAPVRVYEKGVRISDGYDGNTGNGVISLFLSYGEECSLLIQADGACNGSKYER